MPDETFTLRFEAVGNAAGIETITKAMEQGDALTQKFSASQAEITRVLDQQAVASARAAAEMEKQSAASREMEASHKRREDMVAAQPSGPAAEPQFPQFSSQEQMHDHIMEMGMQQARAEMARRQAAYDKATQGLGKWATQPRSAYDIEKDDAQLKGLMADLAATGADVARQRAEEEKEHERKKQEEQRKKTAEANIQRAESFVNLAKDPEMAAQKGLETGLAAMGAGAPAIAAALVGLQVVIKGVHLAMNEWAADTPGLEKAQENLSHAIGQTLKPVLEAVIGTADDWRKTIDGITVAFGGETEAMRKVHEPLEGLISLSDKALNAQERLERGMKAVTFAADAQREALRASVNLAAINDDNANARIQRDVDKNVKALEAQLATLTQPGHDAGIARTTVQVNQAASTMPGVQAFTGSIVPLPPMASPGGTPQAVATAISNPDPATTARAQEIRDKILEEKQRGIESERATAAARRQHEVDVSQGELEILKEEAEKHERQLALEIVRNAALNRLTTARDNLRAKKLDQEKTGKGQMDFVEEWGATEVSSAVYAKDAKGNLIPYLNETDEQRKSRIAYEKAQREVSDAARALPAGMPTFDKNASQEAFRKAQEQVKTDQEAIIKAQAVTDSKRAEKAALDKGADEKATDEDQASGWTDYRKRRDQEARVRKAQDDANKVLEKEWEHRDAKKAHGIDSPEAIATGKALQEERDRKAISEEADQRAGRTNAAREAAAQTALRYANAAKNRSDAIIAKEQARKDQLLADEQVRKDRITYQQQHQKESILDPENGVKALDAEWAKKHPGISPRAGDPLRPPAPASPAAGGKVSQGMEPIHQTLEQIEVNTRPGGQGRGGSGGDKSDAGKPDGHSGKAGSHARSVQHSRHVGGNDGLVTGHAGTVGRHTGGPGRALGPMTAADVQPLAASIGQHVGQAMAQHLPQALATGLDLHQKQQPPKVLEAPKAKQGMALAQEMWLGREAGSQKISQGFTEPEAQEKNRQALLGAGGAAGHGAASHGVPARGAMATPGAADAMVKAINDQFEKMAEKMGLHLTESAEKIARGHGFMAQAAEGVANAAHAFTAQGNAMRVMNGRLDHLRKMSAYE